MTLFERYVQSKNIVDLILLDHHFLREGIDVLHDEDADPREKFLKARTFLGVLRLHSLAEERTIYPDLESEPEFHFLILEAEVQHQLIDQKIKELIPRIAQVRGLSPYLDAEIKVLADLVSNHIDDEEKNLLPLMTKLDEHRLKNLGLRFMKVRKFTDDELQSIPRARPVNSWRKKIADYFHWKE